VAGTSWPYENGEQKTFIAFDFTPPPPPLYFINNFSLFFPKARPGRAIKMSTRKGRQRLNAPLAFSTM